MSFKRGGTRDFLLFLGPCVGRPLDMGIGRAFWLVPSWGPFYVGPLYGFSFGPIRPDLALFGL